MGLNLKIKILIFRLQFSFYPPFFPSLPAARASLGENNILKTKLPMNYN